MSEKKEIHVVAGILFNEQGHFLLSSRPEGKVYAGYWEFAGGKVEAGESELDALKREFVEELDIHIDMATPWLTKFYEYEHASVNLRFFKVHQWHGKIDPQENQRACWQDPQQPNVSPMLPANEAILKALRLPKCVIGSLKGFSLDTGIECVKVLPAGLAAEHDGLILSSAELKAQTHTNTHPWVFAVVENQSDIDLAVAQNADVLIFEIKNQAGKNTVEKMLKEGTPLALLLVNDGELDVSSLDVVEPIWLDH